MTTRAKVEVREEIFTKSECEREGVSVIIVNGQVEEVALTWYVSAGGVFGWKRFPLPWGEAQLEQLRDVMGDAMEAIARAKARWDWKKAAITEVDGCVQHDDDD